MKTHKTHENPGVFHGVLRWPKAPPRLRYGMVCMCEEVPEEELREEEDTVMREKVGFGCF